MSVSSALKSVHVALNLTMYPRRTCFTPDLYSPNLKTAKSCARRTLEVHAVPRNQKWSLSKDDDTMMEEESRVQHEEKVRLLLRGLGRNNYKVQKDESRVQHEEKVMQARHLLRELGRENHKVEALQMIDAIQRLGIDYYFKKEIQEILDRQFLISTIDENYWDNIHDLHETSLLFRLCRQYGHHVPADVFSKFKNNTRKFRQEDMKGLMSLYEAAQLATQEEEDTVLVEAGLLTHQILSAWLDCAHDDEAAKRAVRHTLSLPCHKSLARFSAAEFLSDFHGTNNWIDVLKEVAVYDYDMVKSIHRNEIMQISRWWERMGLGKELKYARSQPVKWHMWSMSVLTDPSSSQHRLLITKTSALAYIIDDIFDVYGSLDQLTLFTQVVNKWEYEAIKDLPECMQMCVKALFDVTSEISLIIYEEHGWNPIEYLKNAWKRLCNAFLVEAKWFANGEVPSADEYLKNAIVSSGVHVPLLHIFFLLGQNITTENVCLVENFPDIISSVATIFRLWDDLGSAKDENQNGHDGSYIYYYMKEHHGTSEEIARERVMDMILDTWKCLNHACLSDSNRFSQTFVEICLNIARMVPLMYAYDEKHNLPSLEKYMKSLLYP